jgi:hypothetical protein
MADKKEVMMSKFLVLFLLVCSGSLMAQGNEFLAWEAYIPELANVTSEDVHNYSKQLTEKERKIFDKSSQSTQKLAVVIMLGLKQLNQGSLDSVGYDRAFILANKAEAGYYLSRAMKRLNVD